MIPEPTARTTDGVFHYGDLDIDARTGTLRGTYLVDGYQFEERVSIEGADWNAPGAEAAAHLVFLLTGVSYYKAFAPPVIDLGTHRVTERERSFLRDYYVEGLGEFAWQNDLDLRHIEITGGRAEPRPDVVAGRRTPVHRPLVPFGGGIDSIVSAELVKAISPDAALFVVSGRGDRFLAIERSAEVTGLPVQRAARALDPQILRSRELGFLNGHVPVTGILSAIAVLAAVVTHRDAVVMSNELSASVGNVERDGHPINHQYSKSIEFERGFREVIQGAIGPTPDYFSLLRPLSELSIARRFATYPQYRATFRSCNRAFHIDPAQRLDRWCGRCDKCAFVDLVLSPFLSAEDLAAVFQGAEPLADPTLVETFAALIGANDQAKPFECVGDVDECRAAVVLAADRSDRAGSVVLRELVGRLDGAVDDVRRSIGHLLTPTGEHFIPEPYASAARLE